MKKWKAVVAATTVAVFFILGIFFARNSLLFFYLQREIQDKQLGDKRIKLEFLSSDSLRINLLNADGTYFLNADMQMIWGISDCLMGVSGNIFYNKIKLPIRIWFNPFRNFLSVNVENNQLKTYLDAHRKKTVWSGNLKLKLEDSDYGDFESVAEIDIDPENKKIQSKIEIFLPQPHKSNTFSSARPVILIPEQQLDGALEFQGDFLFDVGSFFAVNAQSNLILKNQFKGELIYAPDFSLKIRGECQDNLESFAVPFQFQWTPVRQAFNATMKARITETSFVGHAIKKQFPDLKLKSGRILGHLDNVDLTLSIPDAEVLLGESVIRQIRGRLDGNLKRKTVKLRQFEMNFAGGLIQLKPFEWSLNKTRQAQLSFSIKQLSLSEVLKTTVGNKLSGEGFLEGSGLFDVTDRGIQLRSLKLKNTASGKIRYLDHTQMFFEKKIKYLNEFQSLLDQGQQALVLKALENFHYQSLKFEADRLASGELKLLLNLKGKNPDLANGQPFDISLPIEGNIDSLVMGSLFHAPVSDEINRRKK